MDVCIVGWMDGRMDGWTDGCMDAWMHGWMDGWVMYVCVCMSAVEIYSSFSSSRFRPIPFSLACLRFTSTYLDILSGKCSCGGNSYRLFLTATHSACKCGMRPCV